MLNPLHGSGYQLWSGFGGAVLIPVIWKLLEWITPTRCSQLGCRRRAIAVTTAGVPFCQRHLPDGPAAIDR